MNGEEPKYKQLKPWHKALLGICVLTAFGGNMFHGIKAQADSTQQQKTALQNDEQLQAFILQQDSGVNCIPKNNTLRLQSLVVSLLFEDKDKDVVVGGAALRQGDTPSLILFNNTTGEVVDPNLHIKSKIPFLNNGLNIEDMSSNKSAGVVWEAAVLDGNTHVNISFGVNGAICTPAT